MTFAQLGLGLTPSLHEGTVNALPANAYYLQYDAQTEPGNSGGPVFDADTGVVFAIVVAKLRSGNESNIAISDDRIMPFLLNAHVAIDTANRQVAVAAPPPTPLPTPTPEPTPSINTAMCQSGLSDFDAAYSSLNDAFNRYIRSQQSASNSARVATTRLAFSVAAIAAAYEVRAIRSVINAEEPKFSDPQSEIGGSGADDTARQTGKIVDDIHQRDQLALSWSQQRYSLFQNIANGGAGFQLDQSTLDESNRLTAQIDDDLNDLRYSHPCTM
jgi:hypothetical protein